MPCPRACRWPSNSWSCEGNATAACAAPAGVFAAAGWRRCAGAAAGGNSCATWGQGAAPLALLWRGGGNVSSVSVCTWAHSNSRRPLLISAQPICPHTHTASHQTSRPTRLAPLYRAHRHRWPALVSGLGGVSRRWGLGASARPGHQPQTPRAAGERLHTPQNPTTALTSAREHACACAAAHGQGNAALNRVA